MAHDIHKIYENDWVELIQPFTCTEEGKEFSFPIGTPAGVVVYHGGNECLAEFCDENGVPYCTPTLPLDYVKKTFDAETGTKL